MKRRAVIRAVAAVAALFAGPLLLEAQQQQYGQPPNTYTTWSTAPLQPVDVTYYIAPALGARIPMIQQAAAVWNSGGSGIRLVEVGVQAGSNIQWVTTGGVQPYSFSFAGPPTPAGTYPNTSPWSTLSGPATISINTAYPLWDGVGPLPPFPLDTLSIDFQFLSLDLFGRALGLGFAAPGDNASVMQPDSNIQFATPGPHALSPSDIAALQAVYGAPEPSTLALLGIGLGVIGASKRFRRFALGR